MPYLLRGPLPAGDYELSASGYQPGGDAKLHADLVWRPRVGPEQVILSADSNVAKGSDAGTPGAIAATLRGAAVASSCGDQLVLRIKMVAGTSGYIEFGVGLVIP